MEIIIKENMVYLFKDDEIEPIYSICKEDLADVLDENECKISAWINQLLEKSWIEHQTLYKLAKLIQKEIPNNTIDWFNTFLIVENKFYLDFVKKTKQLTSKDQTIKSDFDNLYESINIGKEEQNDLINEEITKIVNEQISRNGLI